MPVPSPAPTHMPRPGPVASARSTMPVLAAVLAATVAISARGTVEAGPPVPQPAADEFRERLDKRLATLTRQHVSFGLRVIELGSGQVLYSVNADGIEHEPAPGGAVKDVELRAFAPASNMKVLTTAAALDMLGRDFKFRTVFGRRGGDLVVVGDGDPAFGDPAVDGIKSNTAEFVRWAEALRAKGVTSVSGSLLLDDTVFEATRVAPGWPRDQLAEWFCAPVGGLNLDTNCVQVWLTPGKGGAAPAASVRPANDWIQVVMQARSGTAPGAVGLSHGSEPQQVVVRGTVGRAAGEAFDVTVQDPGLVFGHVLLKVLSDHGITVAGGVKRSRVRTPAGAVPGDVETVAVQETPLPVVLARCNKKSHNLYAECLLKTLGSRRGDPAKHAAGEVGEGSWESGSRAVRAFLDKLHFPDEGVRIVDGSGLSRENALTPLLLTEVLRHMHDHPAGELYRESLAVAGTDGTLAKRMKDPALKGNVFAKTGFIRGVSGLSGYVRAGGRWFAFSMLSNDIRGSTLPVKEVEDEVCREIAALGARCPVGK